MTRAVIVSLFSTDADWRTLGPNTAEWSSPEGQVVTVHVTDDMAEVRVDHAGDAVSSVLDLRACVDPGEAHARIEEEADFLLRQIGN